MGHEPKRVVLYIDSLKLGGAERVTLSWAQWLSEAGWKPLVLTRQPRSWDFYPLPEGVIRVVEPEDPGWMRRLGPMAFPLRIRRLRHWLIEERIDLAIGVTSLPAIKLLFACRSLGLPCVVSERNYPPLKRIGRIWSLLRRWSYPWADLHLVQTKAVGEWLAQKLGAKRQLLLPNPVKWPLPAFNPHVEPELWFANNGVTVNDPVLLAVGTKSDQKGFDRLVRWWIPLAERDQRLQLVIVGLDERTYHGRDQQAELRSLLNNWSHLQPRLHFPGRVGNLHNWYSRCQVFVLSSRYEGFPNVLLEAMAAGCCCVAADCPQGPADLVASGVNGILMPSTTDDQGWVNTLSRVLKDPSERARLGQAATLVRDRYNSSTLAGILVGALASLTPKQSLKSGH